MSHPDLVERTEYGILRHPDESIRRIFKTEDEARAELVRLARWKEARREEAEQNKAELDADGPLPTTNGPWIRWERGYLDPPFKDMEWEIVYRVVTEWVPLKTPASA